MDFFSSHISPRAIELVTETLRAGRVSEGARVREFEAALAATLRLPRPVAVNSGTAALHLSLAVAGVGPGDEVILPPQTFVATGLAILMQRATPVFADIDPTTGNVSPTSIRGKISPRTKAIMPVHWAGYPCDLAEIGAIAAENALVVIEDAAHALGAVYRGEPIGGWSRFTCFSFQAIKHLTTGDGGAVCCLNDEDQRELRRRRWFGIPRESETSPLGERVYELNEVGFKYHLNDLAAALGLGNLADFPSRLKHVRELAWLYRRGLSAVPGLQLLAEQSDRESACWLFTVRVERRENLIRKLRELEIPASVVHQRIDRHPLFGGVRDDLPGQATFDAEQLSLPLHAGLRPDDVQRVIHAVQQGW